MCIFFFRLRAVRRHIVAVDKHIYRLAFDIRVIHTITVQCHFKHLPTFVKPSSFEHCAVQRARACKFETICQR